MDIHQKILDLLAAPQYRPLRRHELVKALRLAGNEATEFRRTLAEMLRKGDVVRVRKERFVLPAEADLVVGKLEMNERGFGFVIPEADEAGKSTAPADIYVAADSVGVSGTTVAGIRYVSTSTGTLCRSKSRAAHKNPIAFQKPASPSRWPLSAACSIRRPKRPSGSTNRA